MREISSRLWHFANLASWVPFWVVSSVCCCSRANLKAKSKLLLFRRIAWQSGLAMRPLRVLNVAEKNDAAKELSRIMSRGQSSRVGMGR